MTDFKAFERMIKKRDVVMYYEEQAAFLVRQAAELYEQRATLESTVVREKLRSLMDQYAQISNPREE